MTTVLSAVMPYKLADAYFGRGEKKKIPAPQQTRCVRTLRHGNTTNSSQAYTVYCDLQYPPFSTRQARIVNEFRPPQPGPATPDVQRPHEGIKQIRYTIYFWVLRSEPLDVYTEITVQLTAQIR